LFAATDSRLYSRHKAAGVSHSLHPLRTVTGQPLVPFKPPPFLTQQAPQAATEMISVDELPLDRGAYNLLTLVMSFLLCLWILRALLAIRALAFLRVATMQGRTVTLRGLGAFVHIFDSPTQSHMQSILHT